MLKYTENSIRKEVYLVLSEYTFYVFKGSILKMWRNPFSCDDSINCSEEMLNYI